VSRLDHLTGAEIAAVLGVAPATVRTLAKRHEIKPVGKEGKANLYDARRFLAAVGGHDRRVKRKRRTLMAH
jgi:hypothetical protein